MDIIRGISLFGILLMNIVGFGLYKAYYDPTNSGGATGWNLNVWWMNTLFFEGTMRGMFSMLFGAGILLFTERKAANTESTAVVDLFFRRLMWMIFFGVIHCYLLLWDGEVLFTYGIVGMFAFSFRHFLPKYLITAMVVILLIDTTLTVGDYFQTQSTFDAATAANAKKSKGLTLTKADSMSILKWEEKIKESKITPQRLKEEIVARTKNYWSIVMYRAHDGMISQTIFLYRYNFWDTLAMMLFGMAFFKNGILKAAKSTRFYLIMALVGYGIGITINYFEGAHIVANNFSILSFAKTNMSYHSGRVATTCGHIGLIMLFVKSGWLPFLQKSLAAVGQMAFTNYITHSIVCNIIFLGYGFSMYGKLQRYELYYIVVSIWVFQLIFSPIWLRYYRFGPLEWLWRSLTYWKIQPMKR